MVREPAVGIGMGKMLASNCAARNTAASGRNQGKRTDARKRIGTMILAVASDSTMIRPPEADADLKIASDAPIRPSMSDASKFAFWSEDDETDPPRLDAEACARILGKLS